MLRSLAAAAVLLAPHVARATCAASCGVTGSPNTLTATCMNGGGVVNLSWSIPAGSDSNSPQRFSGTWMFLSFADTQCSVGTTTDSPGPGGHQYRVKHCSAITSNIVTVCMRPGGVCGCDDSNPCTVDTCNVPAGCSNTPVTCNTPPSQCHQATGTCNGASGCSYPLRAAGSMCNDGNACTDNDQCSATGACAGTPRVCNTPPAGGCRASTGACDINGGCVYAPLDAGTACTDGNVCTDDACNGAGVCVGTSRPCCMVDGDCMSVEYCDTPLRRCVTKLANGSPIPTVVGHQPPLDGTCSAPVGVAVCLSRACDPADDRCGLLNGSALPGGFTAPACRSGVADVDARCGLANGSGPCNAANGTVRCRSGRCAPTGVCAGCATDSECSAAQYCDTPAGACVAKLANGTPLPVVAGHVPVLDGTCSAAAAMAVCVSATCEAQDDRCGVLPGGPCSTGVECRDGGMCSTTTSRCESERDAGGGGCASDAECGGSTFCQTSACVPALVSGSMCTRNRQCLGGECAGGICEMGPLPTPRREEHYLGWPLGCSAAPGGLLLLPVLALLRRRRRWLIVAALAVSSAALAEERVEEEYARFHFNVSLLGDLRSLQAGFELRADFAPAPVVEVGAAAVIGRYPGARLVVGLHPPRGFIVLPYLQLRAALHPVSDGVGFGGGAAGGVTLEAGPGRMLLDFFFEVIVGQFAFDPWSYGLHLGYELDVY